MTESQNIPSQKCISSLHVHSFHLLNWAKAVYVNHGVNATDKDRTYSPWVKYDFQFSNHFWARWDTYGSCSSDFACVWKRCASLHALPSPCALLWISVEQHAGNILPWAASPGQPWCPHHGVGVRGSSHGPAAPRACAHESPPAPCASPGPSNVNNCR